MVGDLVVFDAMDDFWVEAGGGGDDDDIGVGIEEVQDTAGGDLYCER